MKSAIVFTSSTCPYCQVAKQILQEHGISYREQVYDDYAQRQTLYDDLGLIAEQRTVPQIFAVTEDGGRTYIGGYNDLLRSDFLEQAAVGDFNADF